MPSDLFPVRASSFSTLLDCPHRWEGIYILGLRGKRSGRGQLGTAIHHSTAVFDKSRMDRAGITADEAAGALVDTLHNPEEPVDWGEESPQALEKVGLSLHTKYCAEWSPRFDWKAVEMTIPPLDIDAGGVTIRLTGTMDRCRVRAKRIGEPGAGISDMKTGKTAVNASGVVNTKAYGAQLGVYELLYEMATNDPITEPAEIIGLQTNSKARIGTGNIAGARDLVVGTENQPGLLDYAASTLKAGMFPPNPSSMLCSEKYCPRWERCRFRPR